MKKILIALSLFLILLTGCSGKGADYREAVEAYNNQDYQTAIEIFETLGDYKDSVSYLNQSKQMSIVQHIDELGDNIDDEAALAELISECKNLTQEQFAQLSNSAEFEEKFTAYVDNLGQSAQWDTALSLIQDATMLSDDCVKNCLIIYGKWASIDSAEDYVRDHLKSPRSYYRYDASVSTPKEGQENYTVDVYLDYGATNSFGAEVTNEDKFIVEFEIDMSTRSVQFECLGDWMSAISDALEEASDGVSGKAPQF